MLTWNVYVGKFNSQHIEIYNIFDHISFLGDCRKAAKKYKSDKAAFEESVWSSLMYYFWSKCEWEILLQHWPPHQDFKDEKVDVFDQVRLNWDAFIDYLWRNKEELCRKK